MNEMITSNRESVSVTTKNKHVQVLTAQGNASCKRQCPAVNVVRPMGLYKIWKSATAANCSYCGKFFVMQATVLKKLEI